MAVGSSALRGLVVALLLLAVASTLHAQETCMTSLYDAVATTPELAQLKTEIDNAGLQETFSNKSSKHTFLAPNNTGFENLVSVLNRTMEDIISPKNRAANILLYHVIPSPVFAKDLQNGATVSTLFKGYNLTVHTTSGVQFATPVNSASVVTADIKVCDSVIHIIDTVLLPAALLEIPNYVPPPQFASCDTARDRYFRACHPEEIPNNVPLPARASQADCEMYTFRTPQQKLGGHSRPADDDGEFAADDCESRPVHDEEVSRIPVGMKTTVKAKNPMDDLPEYFRLWD
ncbi:hypothetical protein R1flu_009166 [Riccia fluitans]|uniref:FAS1 domain-containing protein n=1 Tax=Riccia fluitans TaxID=41844 RepID=A0ABD1Z1B2_9MARC